MSLIKFYTHSKTFFRICSSDGRRGFIFNEGLQRRSLVCCSALCCNAKGASAETEIENVASKFVNRNPRNLEFLGIAWKRKGWKFQYPSREFHHRVVFERSQRHTAAFVEHSSGKRIVTASTRELAVMRHLYSSNDVSAAENIGRILAQRCQECGITSMVLHSLDNTEKSEKFTVFCDALLAGGVELSEPEEVIPEYQPGIDYDSTEEVAELERRQRFVYHLGPKAATTKALQDQQRTRGRRRQRGKPIALETPSWKQV